MLKQPNFYSAQASDRQQTQSKQANATTTTVMMVTGPKQMKQGQVWHQVKKTTAGLEFVEQMCFGTVSQKNKKSTPPPDLLLRIQPLLCSLAEQCRKEEDQRCILAIRSCGDCRVEIGCMTSIAKCNTLICLCTECPHAGLTGS